MFDEITNEPEDVFAQTDASAPQMPSPTTAPASPVVGSSTVSSQATSPVAMPEQRRSIPWKLIVLFAAIVGVIVLAFFLSMKILNSRTPLTPKPPEETTQKSESSVSTPQTPESPVPEKVAPNTPPAPDLTLDTDKDGLTDTAETAIGTNVNNPDTDADGLFDKEEADVYRTNPLNPDTDGDTFQDGAEVKNGYNPNGNGKLNQIPQK